MEARLFINFLELAAFISAIYYFKKVGGKQAKWLVYFLGATFLVEMLSYYTHFLEGDSFLNSLKGTLFEENYWLYNAFMLISAVFYIYYFRSILRSNKSRIILGGLLVIYLFSSIIYLIASGVMFYSYSPVTVIFGALLIIISIALFYLELLTSNMILRVYKTLPFYISVAVLIFYLCTTPLFIYSTYFSESNNPEFTALYVKVIISTNFIMYSLYILGFILCSKKQMQ